MSYCSKSNNWDTSNLKFEVTNNLKGGIAALNSGKPDYFLWERFTTKPYVDNGTFKYLGNYPTPWPCFVVAVSEKAQNKIETIQRLMEVINQYTSELNFNFTQLETIAERYQLDLEDIQQWKRITHWSQKQLSSQDLNKVLDTLSDLSLIEARKEEKAYLL